MSVAFKQAIKNIKALSTNEKALVAHCLISSMESKQDKGVEEAWGELAEKRYLELESGVTEGITWKEIEHSVKNINV